MQCDVAAALYVHLHSAMHAGRLQAKPRASKLVLLPVFLMKSPFGGRQQSVFDFAWVHGAIDHVGMPAAPVCARHCFGATTSTRAESERYARAFGINV
ncbi:MAG: hypothetical protein JWQ50_5718 [Caballeronia mineralivorans]|nr:hypothetical protein [Caballeronia mineralivorans]